VLAGFGQKYGLDRETAFKLARAFGSGMGLGSVCGAVTGAFMVFGLGVQEAATEKDTRFRTYDLVREFVRRFEARRGSILCKSLLGGLDPNTEAGRKEAMDRKLFTEVCPGFVEDAAEILEEMLRVRP
jgi:C_GCAxxG_C_C family probable redox protein